MDFISSFEDDLRLYMVLELLPGDLFKMLITRGHIDEEGTVLDVILPLLEVLVYMHEQVGDECTQPSFDVQPIRVKKHDPKCELS